VKLCLTLPRPEVPLAQPLAWVMTAQGCPLHGQGEENNVIAIWFVHNFGDLEEDHELRPRTSITTRLDSGTSDSKGGWEDVESTRT
jgi:hypothetical protein